MPMKISGNAKSATMRWRSRSSLMKSRCARARLSEASLTGAAHDLEVCVLDARRVGLHDAERGLNAAEHRVAGMAVELALAGGSAPRHIRHPRALSAQIVRCT